MLKLTVLGCGTSSGVPRIGPDWGPDWGRCDPAHPRNRRTRASILVESGATRILIDTSPDLRAQLLVADVFHIDAVAWTHDHADHCHGIDDLRPLAQHRGGPLPGFARRQTLDRLRRRFAYVFAGRPGYPAIVDGQILPDTLQIGDIMVHCVDQPHGAIHTTGFRFTQDGHSIGYATDFHEFTAEMAALYTGLDIWVVDALRERPHPTHAHLALSLHAIAQTRPRRAVLTHMDQTMDYAHLCNSLPAGVIPGHDGLVLTTQEVRAHGSE